MKKKLLQSIINSGISNGKNFAIKQEQEYQELLKKSNPPDNGNCWCDTCKEWSMEEKGSVYHCEVCENWHYSSN